MARVHSPSERRRVTEAMVVDHLGIADAIARQYAYRGVELDDLRQVARLGLILAVDRYRPGAGASFAAFAVPTIRGEIKRHFRDHGWVVRPPRRIQELRARAGSLRQELEQARGHILSTAELAEALGVDAVELEECAAADTSFTPLSLDAAWDAHETTLGDRLGAEASSIESLADFLALRRELRRLPALERRIVEWRFAEGLTQSEIAERLSVSQMQVSRILSRILTRLRCALYPATDLAS